MSDDSSAPSFLDRVNTLSFPAVAGLGAGTGFLLAVLGALSVEPTQAKDVQAQAAKVAVAADGAVQDPEPEDGVQGAQGQDAAGAGEARADADDDPEAQDEDGDEEPQDFEDSAQDQDADQDGADAAEPQAADDDGTAGDPDALILEEDAEDDPMTGQTGQTGQDEDEDEDEDDAEAEPDDPAKAKAEDAPPPGNPDAGRSQADRDAEAQMDADELLEAAKLAYDDKRYKDAYRLSTRSHRAQPRDTAQMLRGRSACRLRDENNAREIVRSFKLGDDNRKTLRTFCKERGVRVGL